MALHTHKIFPSCTLAKPSTADWFWIMGYMVKTMNSMIVSPISHLCNKSSHLAWGLVYGLSYWWLRHSGSPQILCVWMAEALRAKQENPDSDYVSVWRMMNVYLFKAEGRAMFDLLPGDWFVTGPISGARHDGLLPARWALSSVSSKSNLNEREPILSPE